MRYPLTLLLLGSLALLAYLRLGAPAKVPEPTGPLPGASTATRPDAPPSEALMEIAVKPSGRTAVAGATDVSSSQPAEPSSWTDDEDMMPGHIVIDVLDAVTRRPLTDIWVQPAPRRTHRKGTPRLQPEREEPALAEAKASPASFRWPRGGSARVRQALILVDGYAPATVEVNVARGGRHEVLLHHAGRLDVNLTSAHSKKASMRLYDANTKNLLIAESVTIGEPHVLEGLAPGRFFLTAETEDPRSFASQEVTVRPGAASTAHLFLAPHDEYVPLRLVIETPHGEAPTEPLIVEYALTSLGSDVESQFKITLDQGSALRVGTHDRFTVFAHDMGFGVGTLWIQELAVEGTFAHSPTDPATVELRVPSPSEFEFVLVDAVTGERTPHDRAEFGMIVGSEVRDFDEELLALSPGHFRAPVRAIRCLIMLPSRDGFLESSLLVHPEPNQVIELPVEPIPSLVVGMVEGRPKGSSVPWPSDFEPILWREDAPDATFRFRHEENGIRFWVDRQGFWNLTLPDLPGFKSGQTTYVWFGEDTELGVQPVGLELE